MEFKTESRFLHTKTEKLSSQIRHNKHEGKKKKTLASTSSHHGTQHSRKLVPHHGNSCPVISGPQSGPLAPPSEACHWQLSLEGS
jgi:hypothetical protein